MSTAKGLMWAPEVWIWGGLIPALNMLEHIFSTITATRFAPADFIINRFQTSNKCMCVTGLEPGCFDLQRKVTGVKRRGQVLQKYRKLVQADGKQRENRPRREAGHKEIYPFPRVCPKQL